VKLTKSQLKQIIKEELESTMEEGFMDRFKPRKPTTEPKKAPQWQLGDPPHKFAPDPERIKADEAKRDEAKKMIGYIKIGAGDIAMSNPDFVKDLIKRWRDVKSQWGTGTPYWPKDDKQAAAFLKDLNTANWSSSDTKKWLDANPIPKDPPPRMGQKHWE